jgi:hypothetical protein
MAAGSDIAKEIQDLASQERVRHGSKKFEEDVGAPDAEAQSSSTTHAGSAGSGSGREKDRGKGPATTGKKTEKSKDKSSKGTVNESWTCKICKTVFSDPKSMILECEVCSEHTCAKCLNLTQTVYTALCRDEFVFMCQSECRAKVKIAWEIQDSLTELESGITKSVEQLTRKTATMESKMVKIDERMEEMVEETTRHQTLMCEDIAEKQREMKQTINDWSSTIAKLEEGMEEIRRQETREETGAVSMQNDNTEEEEEGDKESSWASVILSRGKRMKPPPKAPAAQVESLSTILRQEIELQEKEAKEKEERSLNIILFGAKEPESETSTQRIKEDTEFVGGLLREIGAENIKFDHVIRLGKWNKEAESPRPMRFTVSNLAEKEKIFANLVKLQDAENKFKAVGVRHDLTALHREKYEMKEEAKRQTEQSEDFLYKVRTRKGVVWEPFLFRSKKEQSK